jgi:hypothetical protein
MSELFVDCFECFDLDGRVEECFGDTKILNGVLVSLNLRGEEKVVLMVAFFMMEGLLFKRNY